MDYGQNTRVPERNSDRFNRLNFTAGVGEIPADSNPMEADSLNSARFSDSTSHSRLGNVALNTPELPNDDVAKETQASAEKLGQVIDLQMPPLIESEPITADNQGSKTLSHSPETKHQGVEHVKEQIADFMRNPDPDVSNFYSAAQEDRESYNPLQEVA